MEPVGVRYEGDLKYRPCPEPGCSVVLTEKTAHRHDCRSYAEKRSA